MSTQFYDNQVTTVDYQILFIKRDKEALLDSGREIINSAMSGSGFASWQIARFMQKLNNESTPNLRVTDGIAKPADWSDADAIALAAKVFPAPWAGQPIQRVIGLKPENLKYLQVDFQVISTFDRKPPGDTVGALREIATAIKNRP